MTLGILMLFLEQGIVSGLVTGSIYALLALALVIIFKVSEVPNFAQGAIYMAAAYIGLFLIVFENIPTLIALPITLIICFVGSALFQSIVLKRVWKAKGTPVNLVIATLGFSYLITGLVTQTGYGNSPKTFPALVSSNSIMIGKASLSYLGLLIFSAASMVMICLFLLFNFTRFGQGLRALGMNPRAAQLVGINFSRMQMIIWGVSGAISAIAAILIAPQLLIMPDMGNVVIMAFAAAIIGGFNSLIGAVVGGFIIGIAENLVGLFISSQAIQLAPFVAIFIVLLVRPQGLFGGRAMIKKV